MTRSALALAALVALGACAKSSTAPAAPAPMATPAAAMPAVNPAGRWSVALTAQGQPFDFVMELRQISGAEYGGVVSSQMFPPMNINKATLTGNRMKVSVTAPTGDAASFDIVFEGDTFSGDWSMPGDGSKVSGRRLP
ncbi:MAG: hypothetical protein KF709_04505 [Gemmatimonadaceae bacterium]|nr:hypothetical protein [Gemmatimonadaceae bacterium]